MILETQRLWLRPWQESDAQDLYTYASDPAVGPAAGWPPHTSVDNSRDIIKNVLSAPQTYAVVLKETGKAIGSIGLKEPNVTAEPIGEGELELGYWLGVPYWGQGLIPEAVEALLAHAFDDLGLAAVWCGYYEGNEKSRRVQEKCGFIYHHTEPDKPCPLLNTTHTEHYNRITKAQYKANKT